MIVGGGGSVAWTGAGGGVSLAATTGAGVKVRVTKTTAGLGVKVAVTTTTSGVDSEPPQPETRSVRARAASNTTVPVVQRR
jgi:hypothetical protein